MNHNDPAYPSEVYYAGMSKLEAFAMAAMQGLCADPALPASRPEDFAGVAVAIARATLNALAKEQT